VKKTAVVFALTILSMAVFLPFSIAIQSANAQTSSYSITQVDHKVEVLYSGNVVISDTITVSGQLPESFLIGVPYKYSAYILKSTAYDSNYKVLPVTLGVQMQSQSNFYGASINIPSGSSPVFTIVFILSNGVLTPTGNGYQLDFPAYPSFVTTVSQCNVNLDLPTGTTIIGIDKTDGAVNSTSYQKNNLPALTYSPATATFSAVYGSIQKVNIPTLNRQVTLSPSGAITCTDTYKIISNSTSSISFFIFNLPATATNVVGRDQFSRSLSVILERSSTTLTSNVSLILPINQGESSVLIFEYNLPSIVTQQSGHFILNLDIFPFFDYYINSASVTVTPPEGAQIVTPLLSSIGSSADLTRNVYQESVSINKEGVSYIDSIIPAEDVLPITFNYNSLWIAFHPTFYMWAIALAGSVVVALYSRPKIKASKTIIVPKMTTVGLKPESIKTFTDAYEEKNHIMSEIRSLDSRAQRGRIPRRRYKVQRQSLELRLTYLNQTISDIRETLRNVGGSYSESIRQLESAEVDLNEVELSIKTMETRHEIGELPIEAYRKQLTDLERRKTKIENTISGLLLRLRGEAR
jgi:hypothetical protein